jgi:hypothetical protein
MGGCDILVAETRFGVPAEELLVPFRRGTFPQHSSYASQT